MTNEKQYQQFQSIASVISDVLGESHECTLLFLQAKKSSDQRDTEIAMRAVDSLPEFFRNMLLLAAKNRSRDERQFLGALMKMVGKPTEFPPDETMH